MIEIKSPAPLIWYTPFSMFLAGSIEMGAAEDWQQKLTAELADHNVTLFNPRRDNWDSSWEQSIDNPKFVEQVKWELSAIEQADVVVFYFDPATKSPITLLELGLCAYSQKIIVCCPEGYWRRGNVEIVCQRYGITFTDTFEDFVKQIKEIIQYEN